MKTLFKLTDKKFAKCLSLMRSKYPEEMDMIFWSIMDDPKYEECNIQTKLQLTAYGICRKHGFIQLKAGKTTLDNDIATIKGAENQYLEDFAVKDDQLTIDDEDLIDPFEPRTYKVFDSVSHVPWYQRNLKQKTSAMRLLSTSSREFSTSSILVMTNQRPPLKKPPSLLSQLIPTFVSTSFQIDSLRRRIDPNFDPQEFIEGSKLVSPSTHLSLL